MLNNIIAVIVIITASILLGWFGGNILADRDRKLEANGFDIGTRVTYQTRGIAAGGITGLLLASCILLGRANKVSRR